MRATAKKAGATGKRKTVGSKAKKSVMKTAAPKRTKKAIETKPKASKSSRRIEATESAPSMFLSPEANPAHRQGHRRINLKENPAQKPGRTSLR